MVPIIPAIPNIIGILGRSRVGKDTVANLLVKEFQTIGYDFQIVRLAAPIKEAATALFGFTHDQIEGPAKEMPDAQWNITPRAVFQKITSITMGEMGTDFFTRLLYHKYESGHFGAHIIIPDVRFAHDIDEIHRRGGVVIKVVRYNTTVPKHACEDNIDSLSGDVTLKNNREIADLEKITRFIVRRHAFNQNAIDRAA